MSSTRSSPNSATGNDINDSDNDDVTDADMQELENLFPSNKRIMSPRHQRVIKAAQQLLQRPYPIISTLSLTKSIERDAANLLVDECLLLFTDDLFGDQDDMDPEGYIKYIPDEVDLTFVSRLLRYQIDPTSYTNNITLPQIWKHRLSANGIRLLQTMKIYCNLLNATPSPPTELSSPAESPSPTCKYKDTLVIKSSFSLYIHELFVVLQHDREEIFLSSQSPYIMQRSSSSSKYK